MDRSLVRHATPSDYLLELLVESSDLNAFLTGLAAAAAARLSTRETFVLCGLTVFRRKKTAAAAVSENWAKTLEELHSSLGDGPGLSALSQGQSMHVVDLRNESRWPRYTDAAVDQGVRSLLAVPVLVDGETRAVLTLYSSCEGVFTRTDISGAEDFARGSATALRLALKTAQLQESRSDLEAALKSRTTIDLATGVLMERHRCGQDTAFEILRAASSTKNTKIRDLAGETLRTLLAGSPASTYFDE